MTDQNPLTPLSELTVNTRNLGVPQLHKPSRWKCYMFGGNANSYGMVYTPSEGNVPNRLVRWMMKVCFACTWVCTEPDQKRGL